MPLSHEAWLLCCCQKWHRLRAMPSQLTFVLQIRRPGLEVISGGWHCPGCSRHQGGRVSASWHCQNIKGKSSQGAKRGGVWVVLQAASRTSTTPLPRRAPGMGQASSAPQAASGVCTPTPCVRRGECGHRALHTVQVGVLAAFCVSQNVGLAVEASMGWCHAHQDWCFTFQ